METKEANEMNEAMVRPARWARLIGTLMAALLALVVLPACREVDRTSDQISQAIASIDAAPGNWRAVGTDLIGQLDQSASKMLTQVQTLYTNALGQTQNFAFCAVDFFGARFNDGLRHLLHQLKASNPEPVLAPVVCNTNPATAIDAGTTRLVTLYGYDFASYAQQHPYAVRVEYKDRTVPMDSVGTLSATSNYQISIDLQATDLTGLAADRGPKLVIAWNDADVARSSGARTELPILLPVKPTVRHSTFDVRVEAHADPGWTSGYCTTINTNIPVVESGMVIDTGNGDPGHPGVSQTVIDDNRQGISSLRAYNYGPSNATTINVSGRICGSGGMGPGAIFSRVYRIFLRSS